MTAKQASIGSAMVWIFLLSILLFWLPIAGPLIAGFVGGRKAGSLGNAVIAVLLPGLLISGVLFALASVLSGFPLLGVVAGAGGMVLALAHIGPLLLAAIVGAVI